ncbi:CRISPR-associated endoribonuclease Cas6 [Marinoscillum furvescens]|uniref:CRISPR-associated Cas6 family protein n=1 Tax=Marinoscillum furvescens DSM 4134 TaxID=1122208 RepID=A0A3D9L5C1_MARFU|nr:CRISPR-associated endoribonuclease Cas6 [Marinoscillum furvescens]REE01223.1 CRISPR-associated Cas6 family protein [Marinoscillum furvescens DSM 4134]
MRIRITFKVKNRGGLVPFHHQYLIAQVFKGLLLAEGDSAYKNYAFFSFSGIKGQTKLSRNGLHYNSRKVTIVVSSASREFMDHLVKLVLRADELSIGNLTIIPEIAEEEQAVVFKRETKYVCISPLVLLPPAFNDDSAKAFIPPETDEFSDLLYDSTITRMTEFGIDTSKIDEVQKFQLVPDAGYLQKIKSSGKKFARIYPVYDQDVKCEARGYTFPFTLFAAPEVQDFIFTCGLGSHCYKGFGMLDLAHSDPTARAVLYATKEQLVTA